MRVRWWASRQETNATRCHTGLRAPRNGQMRRRRPCRLRMAPQRHQGLAAVVKRDRTCPSFVEVARLGHDEVICGTRCQDWESHRRVPATSPRQGVHSLPENDRPGRSDASRRARDLPRRTRRHVPRPKPRSEPERQSRERRPLSGARPITCPHSRCRRRASSRLQPSPTLRRTFR